MNVSSQRISEISYYRTGGLCLHFHTPESLDELCAIRRHIQQKQEPFYILGAGSNSLVMDSDWPGHVISLHKLNRFAIYDDAIMVSEAGALNNDLTVAAYEKGFGNLAWMHRLPGQIGGTVRMNARCYGGEISQVASKIESVTPSGRMVEYDVKGNPDVFSGYKDTIFMKNGHIVARVHFTLEKMEPTEILKKMHHCRDDRIAKGQFTSPSCGCVFKNDHRIGVPSGMLLEATDVYNLTKNQARPSISINPKHANFIFNHSHSNSREILELTLDMRDQVYGKFGVWLEYEMEILGTIPEDLKERVLVKKEHDLNEQQIMPLRQKFALKQSKTNS